MTYGILYSICQTSFERSICKQFCKKKSTFLLGPRGTGKSTLIRQALPNAVVYDLLDADVFASLVKRPKLLEEQTSPDQIVAIDEIQKLPSLLDEVHRLIEKRRQRFLLTGSSARKLRRGSANLLAGRAWHSSLFPLQAKEIPDFDLLTYLNTGGLPFIYGSDHASEELRTYTNLYLREEVQAEALTRNIAGFARFLDAAAFSNGQELNYEGIASDSGVKARTVHNYVEILVDTLLAYTLEPFRRTQKRKAITRQKLYFFDVGVVGQLCRRSYIRERSELFGLAFEHFIINEVRAHLGYERIDLPMQYWRSTSQFEVDLIIGTDLAVEIKASALVTDKHLKGLRALREEKPMQALCGCLTR